jgi:hypothetical protein
MSRRFLFPLATGVVCLVAMSPVLAAEQSAPAAGKSPAKATTTTASPDDSGANPDDPGADPGTDPDREPGTPDDSSPTTATSGKGPTTTTGKGSGSGGAQRSTSMCDQPETAKDGAPQVGDAPMSFEAGEAGSVDVERLSETELRVVSATANDGWTEQVATPSGPRVTVKFTRPGQSPQLIRFAASMDQKGTMIHTRVTSCG